MKLGVFTLWADSRGAILEPVNSLAAVGDDAATKLAAIPTPLRPAPFRDATKPVSVYTAVAEGSAPSRPRAKSPARETTKRKASRGPAKPRKAANAAK